MAAWKVLCAVELDGAYSDDALQSPLVERLDERDRRLVTEIVFGTLRWQLALDFYLATIVRRGWKGVDPVIRVLLRLSAYQMWRMDRVPDHAIVDDAVELSKKVPGGGASRFVNGVLRNLARRRPWEIRENPLRATPWVAVSLPEWLWRRWSRRFGVETARMYAESLNWAREAAVRRATAPPGGPPPGRRESDLVPGAWIETEGSFGPSGNAGPSFRIQDEASQLVAFLAASLEGRSIWDACAAPGGKTAILAERAGPTGTVVATELSEPRAQRLVRAREKLGLQRVPVVVADARQPAPFKSTFDFVLADVPCSGLGTLRRNPEIKWRLRPQRLVEFKQRQLQILLSVAQSVRVGGFLLYSTCSTEPEENEQVIGLFRKKHPEFCVLRPNSPPGIESWLDEAGFVRTFPSDRGWDGFFAALMVRRS